MNLANNFYFSYSIRDAEKARAFYHDSLGLNGKVVPMCDGLKGLELMLGDTKLLLYEKEDHVPATYTVLNFEVSDIDRSVSELSEKGILFEHYEGTDEKGISRNEGSQLAWFKDPDGNFISVVQEERLLKYEGDFLGEAPPSPS